MLINSLSETNAELAVGRASFSCAKPNGLRLLFSISWSSLVALIWVSATALGALTWNFSTLIDGSSGQGDANRCGQLR